MNHHSVLKWPAVGRCCAHVLAIGLLPCLLASPVARAEDAVLPLQITMRQLLQVARDKSPRYAMAASRLDAARADVVGAGVLPNPKITYGRYDLASRHNTMYDGPSQQEMTLEVPLPISGQRGARLDAAERRAEMTEADVRADFAELIRDLWKLYAQQLAANRRAEVLQQASSDLEHMERIISGREKAGAASRYDVLRIGLEARAMASRLETARADSASLAGHIGALLGLGGWKPQAIGSLAPIGVPTDAEGLWQQAEQTNPELESARREQVAADAGVEQAKRERWPVPSLLVGTAFTDRPYGLATFAGVSVEIPVFDRNQGGMAKAAAAKQAAMARQTWTYAKTRDELERALDLLTRRRATLEKFEQNTVAALPTLRQMAEDAYRLGQSGLLELLDATRSRTDTQLSHIDLLLAEIDAEVEALMASGTLVSSLETFER